MTTGPTSGATRRPAVPGDDPATAGAAVDPGTPVPHVDPAAAAPAPAGPNPLFDPPEPVDATTSIGDPAAATTPTTSTDRPDPADSSTGELLRTLTENVRSLVQGEVASARQEMTDKALAARPGAALLGGGAAALAKAGAEQLRLVGAPVPARTIESVKADVAAVTEAAPS